MERVTCNGCICTVPAQAVHIEPLHVCGQYARIRCMPHGYAKDTSGKIVNTGGCNLLQGESGRDSPSNVDDMGFIRTFHKIWQFQV